MTKLSGAIFTDRNTTIVGVATILLAVATAANALFDGDPNTVPDWNIIIAQIGAGLGLILAGDGGK